METFVIGRWSVALSSGGYSVAKDGKNVYSGDVKSILNKYAGCFNRVKPRYIVASVCLEDAILQINKKR